MYKVVNADIKEINLKDTGGIYSKDLFIYTMNLYTLSGSVLFDSMRIVYLFAKSSSHVIFRFINMNKYCRKDFRKYSDSYTQIDLYPNINLMKISIFTYFITGDSSSKEIFEVLEFDITNCVNIQRFLHFLYTKYKPALDMPIARI